MLPKEELSFYYDLCIQGYHMLNSDPIKEALWEQINSQIFKYSGIQVIGQACGSHSPGCDLETNLGKFSNKSAKYEAKCTEFAISSYRLTGVCNGENPGTPEEICAEINKRKNFDYYSVILREELPNGGFKYDWYLIPSDYPAFNPGNFLWVPTFGKRGKNAGKQVGWETCKVNGETCKVNGETCKVNGETCKVNGETCKVNGETCNASMSVSFSMSSQLWIKLKVTEEIKQFIITSKTYDGVAPIMDYISLASAQNLAKPMSF
jgi:hypothetical protein